MTNERWVLCPKCKHKLFKLIEPCPVAKLEIKCNSCKEIIIVNAGKEFVCARLTKNGQ